MDLTSPELWIAILQIIAIDIVLGGDNAVVIALACRRLPPRQRKIGILWGTAGAITLRVVLVFFAISLLSLPYLKLVGGALLVWIGIKLLQPNEGEGSHGEVAAATTLGSAVRIIIVADFVMSLDNVIGIAAASKGNIGLVIFGLLVSVPIIVWGSQIVLRLMDRFPVIIVIGAGLLGWISGDLAVTDPAVSKWVDANAAFLHWLSPVLGVLLVVVTGKALAARGRNKPPVDLAAEPAAVENESSNRSA